MICSVVSSGSKLPPWTRLSRLMPIKLLCIFRGSSSKIISVYSLALLEAFLRWTIPCLQFPEEYYSIRLNIRLLKLLSAGLQFYPVIRAPKYTGEVRLKAAIKNLFRRKNKKKKRHTRKTRVFLQTEKGLKKIISTIGWLVIPELRSVVTHRSIGDLHHF